MRWRMEAKGYAAGQAWFRETTWVYGIGLLGYALYLLTVLVYGLLGAPVPVSLFLFHALVWGFYLLAHVPDVVNSGGDRPSWRFREGVAPLGIALVNLTVAFLAPRWIARAVSVFPEANVLALTIGGQVAVIASAYAVHGLVNGLALAGGPVRQRRRPRRSSRRISEPLWDLVTYLRAIPEGETRPTLRLITAIALGSPEWLRTPVLLEGSRHQLVHPDGSINAVMLGQFLSRRSGLRRFVPATELGVTVYRPLARRMARGLRKVPAWPEVSWTRVTEAGWRKCAALIMDAPSDSALRLVFVCAQNVNRSRTMQKVLDHFVRRNVMRLRVQVRSAGVEVGPDFDPAVGAAVREELLREQNAALARWGIREADWEPRGLTEADLRSATVLVVADAASERAVLDRLRTLFPRHPNLAERVVTFTSLDPARLGAGTDLPDPRHGEISVPDSVADIREVVATRLLPLLLAKTAQLSPSPAVQPAELELPQSAAALAQVGATRTVLLGLKEGMISRRERGMAQRLVKLIWAVAYRDPSILLSHGLPEALLEAGGERTTFEDSILWQLLQHRPYVEEVIPPSRAGDYEALVRLLKTHLAPWDHREAPVVLPRVGPGAPSGGKANAT